MSTDCKVTPIIKSKILLVEGKDEINLFSALLVDLGLEESIQLIDTAGINNLTTEIASVQARSGYRIVESIGIIRDADSDSDAAFQSVCSSLTNNNLPTPQGQLIPQIEDGKPKVVVLIIPYGKPTGMLENVCLESVEDDPAMDCIDNFFECLSAKNRELSKNDIPKARVRAFLASREWMEIAYFESLQDCANSNVAMAPISPATATPRVHMFLSSRYTPNLALGQAAGKTNREDRYWNFEHKCFDSIKNFLIMI